MISIAEAVHTILELDPIARESLQLGILNYSAYANTIHKQVEYHCKKNVKQTTLVVTLTRIAKTLTHNPQLLPEILIEDMVIKSPLVDLTYEKTMLTTQKLATVNQLVTSHNDFFTSTQGVDEITIVCSNSLLTAVKDHFDTTPKSIFLDLVAVTVRFDEEYLKVPNVMYAFMNRIALKRINIIEIISTYTEITFILNKKDLQQATQTLEYFFQPFRPK